MQAEFPFRGVSESGQLLWGVSQYLVGLRTKVGKFESLATRVNS